MTIEETVRHIVKDELDKRAQGMASAVEGQVLRLLAKPKAKDANAEKWERAKAVQKAYDTLTALLWKARNEGFHTDSHGLFVQFQDALVSYGEAVKAQMVAAGRDQ